MAAAAAPKEAEPEGEKKKKPILKILLFVVGGIALLGAGFGSAILFIKLTTPKDENPLAIVIEKKGEGAPAEGEHAADAHADAGHFAAPVGPFRILHFSHCPTTDVEIDFGISQQPVHQLWRIIEIVYQFSYPVLIQLNPHQQYIGIFFYGLLLYFTHRQMTTTQ
ncbi:MAG: hypothetical protein EBT35_02710 [Alphaproteobacteria bacterium]|nr:hypothetical protein [Alphaproteobacteria bacterium]